MIGSIVVLIGVTLIIVSNSYIDSSYGYRALAQADATANAGVADALLQLNRNPAFSSAGYSVVIGATIATVTVTQNSPAGNEATIVSTAIVSSRIRKATVVVNLATTTEQPSVVSWQWSQ